MNATSKHVVSGIIGLGCAFVAAWAVAPERHLPTEKLVLLVGSWCPKSLELQRQVAEDPELAKRIVTLTIEVTDQAHHCGRAVDDVLDEAPWLRAFDEAWICRRLTRHAASLHREHFVGLPAWLDRGAPVGPSQSETGAALERHGLGVCPGPRLHVGEAACEAAAPAPVPSTTDGVVERGWDIGF